MDDFQPSSGCSLAAQRNITTRLRQALKDTPVVFLHGARQTGKSTLVQAIAEGRRNASYLTLDDAATLAAATDDPVHVVSDNHYTCFACAIVSNHTHVIIRKNTGEWSGTRRQGEP